MNYSRVKENPDRDVSGSQTVLPDDKDPREQLVPTQRDQGITLDDTISWGFRISMILFGLALLVVAAIYYGVINP